ncbi:hypothetical protein ABTX15_15975 [Micromonospora sp. NPDC094482]|uniref:hypothetical protein n=1 Tax=unclassified Micromonospora TaxID=2617518 RepID=UPI003324C47C
MNRLPSTVLTGLLALTAVAPVAVAAPAVAAPHAAALADASPAPVRAVVPATVAASAGSASGRTATAVRPAQTAVLSVRGAGPFRIGARLDRLTAAGLIDWVAPGCAGVQHAGVTGAWAGVILLAFSAGRLIEVGTATAPPHSPAGATVGMSFAELEAIYGRRGALVWNDAGTASAYLVRYGSRVELFTGHPIRPGVGYFQVGPASFVERNFRHAPSC